MTAPTNLAATPGNILPSHFREARRVSKRMMGSARTGFCTLAILTATALSPAVAADVGTTVVVVKTVTGTLSNVSRQLIINDNVEQNEVIATAPDAATELRFVDGTELQLGPNAKVVLDRFVYDPNPGKGALAVTISEGVLRFTTGNMPHQNYSITTPNGTLGVRGTDLDVAVYNGETVVQVNEGGVFGTPTNGEPQGFTGGDCFAMHGGTNRCSADEQNFITAAANLMNAIILAGLSPAAGPDTPGGFTPPPTLFAGPPLSPF